MEKQYKIAKFDKHSDGKFYFSEVKTTESAYWKVINGIIYYVFGTGKHGVNYKENLTRVSMSEEEAGANNHGCYYKILNNDLGENMRDCERCKNVEICKLEKPKDKCAFVNPFDECDKCEIIRNKTIDEIIKWIDSETDTSGRIKISPTCEMVYEHLKEMKKQITI